MCEKCFVHFSVSGYTYCFLYIFYIYLCILEKYMLKIQYNAVKCLTIQVQWKIKRITIISLFGHHQVFIQQSRMTTLFQFVHWALLGGPDDVILLSELNLLFSFTLIFFSVLGRLAYIKIRLGLLLDNNLIKNPILRWVF